MRSLLGPFVEHMQPGLMDKIIASKPRIIKTGDVGILRLLHDAIGEGTIYIARNFGYPDDFPSFIRGTTPKDAAFRWVHDQEATIQQAPFAYWEGFNEMADWSLMPQYGEFEAERQRLLAIRGIHACIGNFSTGSPPIEPDSNACWEPFYPALKAAHRYGNLLGLHEYGGYILSMAFGGNQREAMLSHHYNIFPPEYATGWLFGRYRKVWQQHIEPNGWTGIRIAITELGLDMALPDITAALNDGVPTTAWTTCGKAWSKNENRPDTEQFYYEQLRWADEQMSRDPYMVGGTIFTWGSSEGRWRAYDVNGNIGDRLFAGMRASPYPDTTRVVASRPGLNLRTLPSKLSAVKKILPYGDIVKVATDSAGWSHVVANDGYTGYTMSNFLQEVRS